MSSDTKRWVRTARCEEIPLREGRAVRFGNSEIAIFNLGERFLAVSNRCPHKNGPLSEGIVSGDSVICPLHAWKVGLVSGEVTRPADTLACVDTFRVRVEAGVILVELPAKFFTDKNISSNCIEHTGLTPVLNQATPRRKETEVRNLEA